MWAWVYLALFGPGDDEDADAVTATDRQPSDRDERSERDDIDPGGEE